MGKRWAACLANACSHTKAQLDSWLMGRLMGRMMGSESSADGQINGQLRSWLMGKLMQVHVWPASKHRCCMIPSGAGKHEIMGWSPHNMCVQAHVVCFADKKGLSEIHIDQS